MRNEHEHMFSSLTVLRTSQTGKDGTKGEEQKTITGRRRWRRKKKRRRTKEKKNERACYTEDLRQANLEREQVLYVSSEMSPASEIPGKVLRKR